MYESCLSLLFSASFTHILTYTQAPLHHNHHHEDPSSSSPAAAAHGHRFFFDTAAMLLTFVSLGKYLESRAKGACYCSCCRLCEGACVCVCLCLSGCLAVGLCLFVCLGMDSICISACGRVRTYHTLTTPSHSISPQPTGETSRALTVLAGLQPKTALLLPHYGTAMYVR